LLLLTGKGRSGKGTICSVLADLVGATNATGYDLGELTTSFGLTALRGKLAAFVPEVELAGRGDRAVIVERLKAIVGQDPVVINLKYRDPVSERLGVRFTIAANTLPALADASGALAARVLAIEHRVSFAGREDFGLLDRLRAERSGIARWALDGLARLRANGRRFTGGRLTDSVSRQLAIQSAPVRVFARERLVVQSGYEAGESGLTVSDQPVQVAKADLYTAYSLWAEANDLTPTSLNWVVRDLKTLLPGLENVRPTGPHGTRYNALSGVALRVVSPDAVPGPLGE
jgi:putative DNA primase/helicase